MIKKIVLAAAAAMTATAASAADLPRRAEAPVFTPVPVFTWTGFFFGTEASYTFTDRQVIRTTGNTPTTIDNVTAGRRLASVSTETDSFGKIGGGGGYNWQLTPGSGIVIGVAANINWLDVTQSRFALGAPIAGGTLPNPANYRQSLDWFGTALGRVGYGFDRVLVYGTGGFAFGQVFYDVNFFNPAGALQFAGRYDDIETGFAYGGGIEYAIPTDSFLNYLALGRYLGIKSDAITLKAEYIRYDLGSRNVVVNAIPGVGMGSYTSRFTTEGSVIRAGFNYKFGG